MLQAVATADWFTQRATARQMLTKAWRREWMIALIDADNPDWDDLCGQWFRPKANEGSPSPVSSTGRRGF
jgi:nuclear transport factor 2 (NTF2) superfamily protein